MFLCLSEKDYTATKKSVVYCQMVMVKNNPATIPPKNTLSLS